MNSGLAFQRAYFPTSQASVIRHKLITAERITGTMNKYIQLKTVRPTKRIARVQVTKGMSLNVCWLQLATRAFVSWKYPVPSVSGPWALRESMRTFARNSLLAAIRQILQRSEIFLNLRPRLRVVLHGIRSVG